MSFFDETFTALGEIEAELRKFVDGGRKEAADQEEKGEQIMEEALVVRKKAEQALDMADKIRLLAKTMKEGN